MASQVLSGAANASYTNNTGQNVRLIINYMQNVTRMTWAGVTVNADSTTIGKDIQNITGEFRNLTPGRTVGYFVTPSGGGASFSQTPPSTGDVATISEAEVSSKKAIIAYPSRGLGSTEFGSGLQNYSAFSAVTTTNIQNSPAGGTQFPNVPSIPPRNLGTTRIDLISSTAGGNATNPNLFYVPTTISRGGNFPVELMLAPNQAFSAVCGAFNAIVIKEDGT